MDSVQRQERPRSSSAGPSALHVVLRVAAGLFGGYAFVWGLATLGIAAGVAVGAPYDQAHALASLLAFFVFLFCFCWAFVSPSLARVWTVLAGGGAAMTALSLWLTGTLT